MKKNNGFSLIELMVVMAIIAILSVIGINGYSSSIRKGRDARRKADVNAIAQALALYRMDKGKYPSEVEYSLTEDDVAAKQFAFLKYITESQLYDPDKKNKGAYFYFCKLGGVGSGATCRSFIVCALMETADNKNWEWTTSTPPALKSTGYTSNDYSNVKGGTDFPTGQVIDGVGTGGTGNWYCISSI